MNEQIRTRSRQKLQPSMTRRLRFEVLESRQLLAQAILGEHHFREDDFALSGTYNYYMLIPSTYDDRMNNATYNSSVGHITWTSPDQGTGFFEGTSGGSGSSRFYYSGWRSCASYTLQEQGRFEFSIEASQSLLHITNSVATSTGYSYYKNTSSPPFNTTECNQPAQAPARFFGGLYDGVFNPGNHTVAVNYQQASPQVTVTAPAAPINWTGQAATDFVLNLLPYPRDITLPQGWSSVVQTSSSPPLDVIDLAQGGLKFTVDVNGKPAKTSNVLTPVATVRLFWASSDTDTSGTEIPITSPDPVGVYWNSSQLEATIEQFPAQPPGATHVRVLVQTASGITDANLSNNSRYLRIADFQALDSAGDPISEDTFIDGQSGSVLHPSNASDPNVRVFGYDPHSQLGIDVQILDDNGGYVYDPRQVADIQALAQGETASDEIYFWAIKHQMAVDAATHTITIQGVNDLPVALDDVGATTSGEPLVFTPASLLANDFDVDHGDQLTLRAAAATSLRGAAVAVVLDGAQRIQEIVYDPRTSEELLQMAAGQQIVDEFTYEIVDAYEGIATARVRITVTGAGFTIDQVQPQVVLVGEPLAPIALVLTDADGDASDLLVTAASASDLIAAGGLQVSGTGDTRTLTITLTPATTGRAWITVTASDALGRSATMSFPLIVGVLGDRDLDGAPDSEEDAAPNGGDMNGDGQPDSWQGHVASLQGYGGQAYVVLSVPPGHFLAQVTPAASPPPSGPAADAQFPMGLVHYEIVLEEPGATSEITFRTNLATPVVNRYFQHQDAGGGPEDWQFLMHDTFDGARVYSDRIVVTCRDGGRADQDGSANGRMTGNAALASVAHPWQNLRREDVDNNGLVSPLDVLILVNVLNLVGGGAHELGARPTQGNVLPAFLDPSGNDSLEPGDVLQIINFLNAAPAGGESELWAGLGTGTPSPVAETLWRSEPRHQGASANPRSPTMDGWATQLPRRSDSVWSDLAFGQRGEASSQIDELFDELLDELGAAAFDLIRPDGDGVPSTSAEVLARR